MQETVVAWILVMTLWTGPGPDQQKKEFKSFQACKEAGIAWLLEKRNEYGQEVRATAYCQEVEYGGQMLYGQVERSRYE